MTQNILQILAADKRWRKIPRLELQLQQAVREAFRHLPKKLQLNATVNLLLTTDAEVKQLNCDFRGLNKPTNVLSFPQHDPADLVKMRGKKGKIELGDIAIAYQYMVVESKKDHKILINHLIHLVIHGLLHLLGYDHLSDTEARGMERLETKIMAALDLPDPYRAAQPMELKKAKATGKKKFKKRRTVR